ncbi:MAG: hypothetical protein JXR51_09605, partial [Bacteroidales bacterium]|nr:hypothetical protein [Bacteroidales bacterium]
MSNLKSKVILIKTDSIKFDSLSVIPNSIILKDEFLNFVNDSDFLFDYAKSKIIIINNKSEYYNRLFFITYRVFPCNFDENFNFKDTSLILKNFEFDKTKKYHASANENKFLSDNKFYKNGTISRGFVFGNQRDLSTVSNLNLQLSGKINEEVSIRAAISENNMPIQPEGNTQQIQEFDKVYIELFTDKSGVIMGDLEIKNKYSYFMNMDKKVRGINFYSGFDISKEKNIELKSEISGSLAKGKYNKLKISGIEGSQGPYKLFGANNEIYIIILSGSEKVFIDGKLLIRGLNNDYTIDYNSAEISFTTNNLITKDSRITVEYEYAERNFSRMVFYQTNYLQTKKANFWLNFYSEKDNKNDPLNNLYTDDNKKFLSEIGDSIQNANFSNFKTVEYNSDKILYRLTDSVVGGIYYDSVFVYSTDSYSAIYELYFSYVGANKGNYNPVISNVNGRIYKWTATENGIMQGSYSPLIQLITPKSKLMTSIGSDIKISDKTTVLIEMAISDFDANTYSQINDNDDVGYAFKLNFTQNFLNSDTSENKLEFFINYKMADDKFSPIENYNTVEFERDWNLLNQTVDYQEQNIISGLTFYNKNVGFLQLNGNLLQKQNNYLGKKANFISDIKFKTFQLFTDISYLNTDDFLNKTNYTKHNTILSKHFKYLTIGVSEYSEDNRWRIFETDSLINNSFKFEEYTAFINQGDSSKQK